MPAHLPRIRVNRLTGIYPYRETPTFSRIDTLPVLGDVSTENKCLAAALQFTSHLFTPPFCTCEPVLPTGRPASRCHGRHKKARSKRDYGPVFSLRGDDMRANDSSPKGGVILVDCNANIM